MSTCLIFDLETDGLMDTVSTIHCLVTYDVGSNKFTRYNSQGVGRTLAEGLFELSKADVLIGHNIMDYDIPVLHKLHPNWKTKAKLHDTLVLTRLCWPDLKNDDFRLMSSMHNFPKNLIGSHSLKAWGLRLGELKGDFMATTTDLSEWSLEMEEYCEQDVRVTLRLYREIMNVEKPSPASCRLEHTFASIIRRQEKRGFSFDMEAAEKLAALLQIRRVEIQEELQKVFEPLEEEMKSCKYRFNGHSFETKGEAAKVAKEWAREQKAAGEKGMTQAKALALIEKGANKTKSTPFNCGSRDQIVERFKDKYAWKPKQHTDSGKAKLNEAVLKELDYPEAKPLLEYLLVSKRLGQVAEGKESWMGMTRGGRIHGRVKTNGAVTGRCTHSHPNMAQVPRVGSTYGEECRSLFRASKGYKLIGCDASGLELRCLAHFMARYDGGAYTKILLDGDIHLTNQEAAGLPTRDAAKTFIYAFLYGAGDEKIGSIVGGNSGTLAEIGNKLKKRFLDKTPALKKLRQDVQSVAEHRGFLTGLDGRKLPVRFKHAALNTLLQSAGALVMKQATIIFDEECSKNGYTSEDVGLVAHVHDEMQIEAKESIVNTVSDIAEESVRSSGKWFEMRCPLDAQAKIGNTWAETH